MSSVLFACNTLRADFNSFKNNAKLQPREYFPGAYQDSEYWFSKQTDRQTDRFFLFEIYKHSITYLSQFHLILTQLSLLNININTRHNHREATTKLVVLWLQIFFHLFVIEIEINSTCISIVDLLLSRQTLNYLQKTKSAQTNNFIEKIFSFWGCSSKSFLAWGAI